MTQFEVTPAMQAALVAIAAFNAAQENRKADASHERDAAAVAARPLMESVAERALNGTNTGEQLLTVGNHQFTVNKVIGMVDASLASAIGWTTEHSPEARAILARIAAGLIAGGKAATTLHALNTVRRWEKAVLKIDGKPSAQVTPYVWRALGNIGQCGTDARGVYVAMREAMGYAIKPPSTGLVPDTGKPPSTGPMIKSTVVSFDTLAMDPDALNAVNAILAGDYRRAHGLITKVIKAEKAAQAA